VEKATKTDYIRVTGVDQSMMTIVHEKLYPKGAAKKAGSVRAKRMRNSDGKLVRVLSLDANSATFIDDLTTVFQRNVAKARRENRQLLGSADGVRAEK
jgi:hypothetical protein